MKTYGNHAISRRVFACEILAFLLAIAVIWLDEIMDIPHLFLGAPLTLVNWRESLFESFILLGLGSGTIWITSRLFQKMKHLEGILPVCASCKRIRDDQGRWIQIEEYIRCRSEADFSHGMCPECAQTLYPEFQMESKGAATDSDASGCQAEGGSLVRPNREP